MKTRTIRVSLNEIDSYTRRAARGAGYEWGLAEEAGKAASWLASHGLQSVAAFSELFEQTAGNDKTGFQPVVAADMILDTANPVCPITLGSYLSDIACDIRHGTVFAIPHSFQPLILAPFVGRAARTTNKIYIVSWKDCRITISPMGPCVAANTESLNALSAIDVRVSRIDQTDAGKVIAESVGSIEIDCQSWSKLESLAARTYVTATEKSRSSGAGAGLKDID